jgi:hypothetical protein
MNFTSDVIDAIAETPTSATTSTCRCSRAATGCCGGWRASTAASATSRSCASSARRCPTSSSPPTSSSASRARPRRTSSDAVALRRGPLRRRLHVRLLRRPGTPAHARFDDLPREVKSERLGRLVERQKHWSLEANRRFEGREVRVLVKELGRDGATWWALRPAPHRARARRPGAAHGPAHGARRPRDARTRSTARWSAPRHDGVALLARLVTPRGKGTPHPRLGGGRLRRVARPGDAPPPPKLGAGSPAAGTSSRRAARRRGGARGARGVRGAGAAGRPAPVDGAGAAPLDAAARRPARDDRAGHEHVDLVYLAVPEAPYDGGCAATRRSAGARRARRPGERPPGRRRGPRPP